MLSFCFSALLSQISDVAWAPMSLRIPDNLESIRARNASVAAVSPIDDSALGTLMITTLVLDDNALVPALQGSSVTAMVTLMGLLQVLSCERCGLQAEVTSLIPQTSALTPSPLQELHLAQVSLSTTSPGELADSEGSARRAGWVTHHSVL